MVDEKKVLRVKAREYQRNNYIFSSTNGKRVRLNCNYKREYPNDECCEACEVKVKGYHKSGRPISLNYHHWNNEQLEQGMWLCSRCHIVLGQLDKIGEQIARKYLELKHKIIKSSDNPFNEPAPYD